ncbi:TPA: hypothetical protein U0919_002221 [Streptococcus suis]|nr:hypothetical protein [Streptococcus suis]
MMVLDGLPETDLFDKLEAKRKHGRKDFTIQSYFIAYIAKIVLQLETNHLSSRSCANLFFNVY